MAEKDIIEKNLKEYLEIGDYAYSKKHYKSAVIMYYKALVELCDLTLLRTINKIGINHNERFELLKNSAPELYEIASKLFRFYSDSYNKEITETIATLVKKEVDHAKRTASP